MTYSDKDNLLGNTWRLDSGCRNHMLGNKSWFYDLDERFTEIVKLGNNSCIYVMGKGILNSMLRTILSIQFLVCFMSQI